MGTRKANFDFEDDKVKKRIKLKILRAKKKLKYKDIDRERIGTKYKKGKDN